MFYSILKHITRNIFSPLDIFIILVGIIYFEIDSKSPEPFGLILFTCFVVCALVVSSLIQFFVSYHELQKFETEHKKELEELEI
jgi:ABC-type uncharacterized transport system permease subunit